MKFLIVDDSRTVQTIIKRILESVGYRNIELRTASNGEEALATVASWRPDLILTDWHMPGMSGLEMLQVLKQSGCGDIKVGFVTTESSARHIEEARKNGAVFVVNKPFNNEVLKQAVLSVLQDAAGCEEAIEAAEAVPAEVATARGQVAEAADITRLLSQQLAIACKVEPIAALSIDHVRLPYVIGVYTEAGSKAVHAVCLLDLNAACMIGGAMAKLPVKDVKEAIASMTLSKEIFENASLFLADIARVISDSAGGRRMVMSSNHLVQKPFEKLYEMMRKNYGRSDFNIAFSDYGDGLMSILLS